VERKGEAQLEEEVINGLSKLTDKDNWRLYIERDNPKRNDCINWGRKIS
jgi:hypothetical protein